jgi:hypothetical protein
MMSPTFNSTTRESGLVEARRKGVGLSVGGGQGMREDSAPVPPRGFWEKAEHSPESSVVPACPIRSLGGAEVVVVHAPL